MKIWIGYEDVDRLLTYPDVRYLSACVMVSVGPRLPFPWTGSHLALLLSGVTPLRWALHQFGGGVMLPNWCNAPQLVHDVQV